MTTNHENPYLQVAIRAARAGGELALSRLGNPGYMRWKEPGELQAGASLDIQEKIVSVIRAEFPDHHFLVEEMDEPQDAQADPLWIIDPIDGSMNFNQSLPLFAISIALRMGDRYELGVVYDPCHNELFHATLGQGAYRNDEPIYVDKLSEGEDAYARAMVGTDVAGSFENRGLALYVNRMLGMEITQLWTLGSPALGLCYVAAGRLHSYFSLKLALWDVAAAGVILRESGATFTDLSGGSWLFSKGGYLATNGVIHGSMLRGILPSIKNYKDRQGKVL
jgi:myo-inositol-1(or 4)-monophosphatase